MKYASVIFIFPYLFNNCLSKQYKVLLTSHEICKDPALPYANQLPFQLILDIYSSKGSTLLRGNLTALKDIPGRDLRGTFSYGAETPIGVKWILTMKDLNCNSVVTKAIIGSFGLPINGCMLKKGLYIFKDVDVDAMDSAFTVAPARTYGLYVTRGSIINRNETLVCWVCHIKITPLRKH